MSGIKWYKLCSVRKGSTLAKSKTSDKPESFWKLYEGIGEENALAISKKEEFEKMKAQFYKEHPDVLERHLKNKAKKAAKSKSN